MTSAPEKKYYYDVVLALPATWTRNSYTYSSDNPLNLGAIVKAPFGKSEKLGTVTAVVKKPNFEVKPLGSLTEFQLPDESRKMIAWLESYYPGTPGVQAQLFLPSILNSIDKLKLPSENVLEEKLSAPPELTDDQIKAFAELTSNSSPDTQVLHGITGSGKTRLYCELAKDYMSRGKNVLILYPEISLTSQLEQTLQKFFGNNIISVYHSKRTPTEQKRTWVGVHNSSAPQIVIGPRSALFLPHKNIGLIIIDEAHDGAYKQDSGSRYNGLIAAGALAKFHKAKLIMGSATPPVQETQQILSKGGSLVCMHSLAKPMEFEKKDFVVVDMREKQNKTTTNLLSKKLVESIEYSLSLKKQSLLFLNRRGTARLLICENCGWHAECPRCDMPLTHHHDSFRLQCHVCGYNKPTVKACPECSNELKLKNLGTKAIEEELKSLFPNAKIARFDSDNKKADSFSENFEKIKDGDVDILIGTQLITKGLDLPNLETVGVLQADGSLFLPDYSSEERTFQQLTQVSGRVGRGHNKGKVIIQTYQPDNFLFKYVTDENWHGFYEQELAKRELAKYPPYSYAMKIWVAKPTYKQAEEAAQKLASPLASRKDIRTLGPAPGFYGKSAGSYVWQIVVMSPSRLKLSEIAKGLPKGFLYDLDPISLI